jgi:hypothetical protein
MEDDERETLRLKDNDYELIVDYLQVFENFKAVTGRGRKTSIGKKYGIKAVNVGHHSISWFS